MSSIKCKYPIIHFLLSTLCVKNQHNQHWIMKQNMSGHSRPASMIHTTSYATASYHLHSNCLAEVDTCSVSAPVSFCTGCRARLRRTAIETSCCPWMSPKTNASHYAHKNMLIEMIHTRIPKKKKKCALMNLGTGEVESHCSRAVESIHWRIENVQRANYQH